jgi:hypothetical protein
MYRCLIDALEFDGPALVCVYTTCQPEHGVADNMATDQARLAVDTRAFPLLAYDPRKGDLIRERLSLQGNPAVNDDWWTNPKTGEQVDFIDFCRSEGRFGKHFDREGNPSELLLKAKQERLENWKQLQELAGLIGGAKPKAEPKAAAAKPAAKPAKPAEANGNGLPPGYSIGSRIRYNDGAAWLTGVIKKTNPAVLQLDDGSAIEVSGELLREAIAIGVVALQS